MSNVIAIIMEPTTVQLSERNRSFTLLAGFFEVVFLSSSLGWSHIIYDRAIAWLPKLIEVPVSDRRWPYLLVLVSFAFALLGVDTDKLMSKLQYFVLFVKGDRQGGKNRKMNKKKGKGEHSNQSATQSGRLMNPGPK